MRTNPTQSCSSVVVIGLALSGLASGAAPQPNAGWWMLDEGSGTVAQDRSGNGRHGTIEGSPPWTTPGWEGWGACLQFGGDAARVNVESFDVTGTGITLAAWIRPVSYKGDARIISKTEGGATSEHYWAMLLGTVGNTTEDRIQFRLRTDTGGGATAVVAPAGNEIPLAEWSHVAVTWDASDATKRFYTNGVEVHSASKAGGAVATSAGKNIGIGNQSISAGAGSIIRPFDGLVDDVRIYDYALSADEMVELLVAVFPARASAPSPANGAEDVSRAIFLDWTPGINAENHDVYLGTVFDDVNDATTANPLGVLVSQGQAANTVDPGRLAFDQTYYWRVDEVNGAPDFTVFTGDVWSFTVEPIAIPITGITATAPSSFGTSLPENTTNGSGLVDDLHGTSAGDMWISTGIPATIEYAFDRVYKLHELWIWNSNQLIEAFVGFGAKDVVIEYSFDGENWTVLDGVAPLAQGAGAEGYAHNNTIDFGGASAQHVRVTINSVQGIAPQASLSEVRFFSIPTLATRPSPQSGATDVDPGTALSWGRDGREADRHDVYFGIDPDNLPLAGTVSQSSFDTGALGLLLGQTYHWRVDEVNEAMDPSVWGGSVWSFSIVDSIVVDDMESYEDKEFLEIWATWVDGFEDPANGSLVGGAAGLPETTITHGGGQSLPLDYDNTGAALSEATRTFDPAQDWTIGSPETLVVHFHGALSNSGGQVYVKINNVKVTYDANPAAISSPVWTQWNIDLMGVGVVNSLTIGVEGAGAQGVLYVDDMILYRQAPAPVGAQDPGTDNLVAFYALDNNAQDGSGNGHHGTLEGSPIYISPGWDGTGACMQFGGQDTRITVESFDVTGSGITLAAWINPNLFTNDARIMSKSQGGGTADHYWAMVLSGGGEDNLQFRLRTDVGATTSHTSSGSPLQTDEWTHIAVTWDAADPTMRLFKNSQEISSVSKAGTAVGTGAGVKIGIGNQSISALAAGPGNEIRPFEGLVDEVRVYSRGLSVAELIHVAFGVVQK